jgi:heterodisulfide reductase subunit C
MSLAHKMIGVYVLRTGHAVPIAEKQMKLREALGLDPQPPTTQDPKNKEQLEQVQTIFKETNYDKMIGFDWNTMNLKEAEGDKKK